jgi:DNA helicase HerA-like ATPase
LDPSRVGVVLSGATTSGFDFIVLEGREDRVREGQYVVARDGGSFIGLVERLEYRHEFYEEGDVWVEAIRRGHRPPDEAARRYLKAKARIVGFTRGSGLEAPPRPPRPGSPVEEVTGEDLRAVYGFNPESERPEWALLLGSLYGYAGGLGAPLDLRALTMHVAVVGTTGSGKSNTVGVVIEELGSARGVDLGFARLAKTIPAIVVDANGDYVDYYCDPSLVPGYTRVYRLVLEDSDAYRRGRPYKPGQVLAPVKLDLDIFEPEELAEVIATFYHRGAREQAAHQEAALQDVLDDPEAGSYTELFYYRDGVRQLEDRLRGMVREGLVHRSTAEAVVRQLRRFQWVLERYKLLPEPGRPATLGRGFVDDLTNPESPGLAILDFSVDGAPAPLEVKQLIVYYLSKLLFDAFVEYKAAGQDRALLYVIEEAQNYAPNLQHYQVGFSIARSVLHTIATQGRKFGLSLAIVTQRPRYVDPVVLSMANTLIIHRVSPGDVGFVEQVAGGLPKGLMQSLATMERGVAIVVGQMNPSPLPTVVRVRRRRSHRVGGSGVQC